MPSTPLSATYCPNDPEARAKVETLRSTIVGDPDTAYERIQLALALKLEELCAVRDQRDAALVDVQETETERDNLGGQIAELEKARKDERAISDKRLVENVKLRREVAELEKRPGWIKAGGVGIVIGAVATVATFFFVKLATP